MIKKFIAATVGTTLCASALITGVASAQDDDPTWSIEGYAGFFTDYRDRGLTLSDLDPTIAGSLAIFHKSGLYGGLDAAKIDDGRGGDTKTEFYLGYSFDTGSYIYDFSVELDGIHGSDSNYYSEFKASVARDFGIAFIRGGLAYAPEGRWNTPDVDSFYAYTDLELPVPTFPELTFISHVGYDARNSRSNLWDWSIGISAFIESFEVSVSFEDSSLDQAIGNGRFVLNTKIYF